MSVPRSLRIPDGVEVVRLETTRQTVAAHVVRVDDPVAHVLLVPGWTGSKEDFTAFLPLLAAAGLDATAYDQRGQWETPGEPDDDYSLEAFADDALAVARAVTDAPSHLLGHSFGGLVAQTAAVRDADAWRSLSLLCTGPGALGDSPARPLGRLVEAIGDLPLATIHALRESAGGLTRTPEVAAFLERRFTGNAPASLRAITQHLVDAPDRVDEVARTALPVWVGRGEDDDAWPHARQEELARRLGTTVAVVPDSAHSPAVENPQGLGDAWLPFLQAHA